MNAHALLKRFDIVADQPGNIPALRRLIVDLAVRGKLLAADALDMDVQEMLRRISTKADQLVSAGAIKKLKLISEIGDNEVPAAYLAHCTFARLGSIANLQKGLTGIQSSTPGEFPLVVTSADRGTCDHFDFEGASAIIPLVSSTGHGNASINRLHYQEGKFALGTILCAVFPFDEQLVSARFLYEYLTAFKEELLVSKMIGTANVTLTLGKIAEVPVPILAPAVQRRVDELMALCDQLEAAQQERERRRERLANASLQRLNQPAVDATPETQRQHARFHLHHLPRLTTRSEHIKAIRQTILNLAVRGKLTKPDTADEPVATLLAKFQAKRLRVLKKPLKNGAAFSNDSDCWGIQLPVGWAWSRLGHLCTKTGSGSTPAGGKEAYVVDGVPFLRSQNIYNDGLRLEGVAFISEATQEHMPSCRISLSSEISISMSPSFDLYFLKVGAFSTASSAPTIFKTIFLVIKLEQAVKGYRRTEWTKSRFPSHL
jgi:type I restriction enzyme, S subunit